MPVGLFIPFDDEAVSGELGLLSFVHTASGAWLTATWRTRDPLGRWVRWHHDVPPVEKFTVIDDRGLRYQLGFRTSGRPNSACALSLHPDPPEGIGWLGITAPGGAAVRVSLERQDPGAGPAVTVSQTGQEAGEQMLNQLAERLLVMVPDCPQYLHLEPGAAWPGPLTDRAAGLGGIVAALEAAEILPPLSPVPGQLAALCARLRIDGHGIHAAPAHDLPEPWLSLLSHYHRRKPDPPARDGSAPLAAALPELDGIRLVLLGLHNADGTTWMHALAIGQIPDHPHARLGLDATFPLSVWIRDSAGRWHAACTRTWHNDDGQRMLTLRLVPPLARGADWIEVAAAGRSAEARARLPLCWGYPP